MTTKLSYTLSEAIQILFTYRARNVRASQDVLEKGLFILDPANGGGGESGLARKMGDECEFPRPVENPDSL
jgi:hypothetical protein